MQIILIQDDWLSAYLIYIRQLAIGRKIAYISHFSRLFDFR